MVQIKVLEGTHMKKSFILVHDHDVEGKVILDMLHRNKELLNENQIDYLSYSGS